MPVLQVDCEYTSCELAVVLSCTEQMIQALIAVRRTASQHMTLSILLHNYDMVANSESLKPN